MILLCIYLFLVYSFLLNLQAVMYLLLGVENMWGVIDFIGIGFANGWPFLLCYVHEVHIYKKPVLTLSAYFILLSFIWNPLF